MPHQRCTQCGNNIDSLNDYHMMLFVLDHFVFSKQFHFLIMNFLTVAHLFAQEMSLKIDLLETM